MRIACVQFAPQVGDIDNNLNRADSVLAKANPDDLEDLDLLVLPELAFTGYNFKSLNQISPFLEPQGSGISALWARTTALKYNTNVVVGYPERVDVTAKWPTGPEYYSSTIVVNGDGETIANYRKSFLYVIDETWALEGKDGFFAADIPQLGTTAMGICMDLNPYRFEAPWHAFEFAFHIVSMEANLVIVTMAWVTREDGRHYSRMPEEPDLETLTYWVQRLEPVIRAEGEDEVIVVFCNRTGTEDDLVYAGTSSVIGIKGGEVNVYGVLGRSVKDVLVIDTDNGPFAKLVQRTDRDVEAASQVSGRPRKPSKKSPSKSFGLQATTEQPAKARKAQRKPSPTPSNSRKPRKVKLQSPRIQIPEYRHIDQYAGPGTPIDESPGVATPTCPSPTPFHDRPNLVSPGARPTNEHVNTPYPHDDPVGDGTDDPYILGGHVSINLATPSTASPISGRLADKYFWRAEQPPLVSPMESRFPQAYSAAESTAAPPVALVSLGSKDTNSMRSSRLKGEVLIEDSSDESRQSSSERPQAEISSAKRDEEEGQETAPPRPASPKSRNASRTGERHIERRASMVTQPDLGGVTERLESMARRPGSAMDSRYTGGDASREGRPPGPRSTSRMGRSFGTPQDPDERTSHFSPGQPPYMGSPGFFTEETARPQSDITKNREHSRNAASSSPYPRNRDTSRNMSFSSHVHARSNSNVRVNANTKSHIEPDESRTLVWSELSKMVGEVFHQQPETRNVSRGRHRNASFDTPADARVTAVNSEGSRPRANPEGSRPRVLPRTEQRFASQERRGSTPIRTILAPDSAEAQSSPYNPDDEIVAEIIFHGRPPQGQPSPPNVTAPSQAADPKSPPLASAQKGQPRQAKTNESHQRSRETTPQSQKTQSQKKTSSRATPQKRPSFHDTFGEIKVFKAPTPANLKIRPGSNESCPRLEGSSMHTLSTPKGSPATPSRTFEPKTPKAMKLDPDFGTILSSTSDPNATGEFPPLDSMANDILGLEIPRAKSTVW